MANMFLRILYHIKILYILYFILVIYFSIINLSTVGLTYFLRIKSHILNILNNT